MRCWVTALAGIGLCLATGQGMRAEDRPSVDAILLRLQQKNAERQGALESYTSERLYRVEYHGNGGEHHGAINVHVTYTDQGAKHMTVVSETGSKLICDRVLRKMVETEQESSDKAGRLQTMLSSSNYNFEFLGEEAIDGVESWVLRVVPRVENKLTYRGRVWISEDDFAVVRVQGELAKSPSWWLTRSSFDWRYARHGEFWLPESSAAFSHVRLGGDATLTIEYGGYQIVTQSQAGQTKAEVSHRPSPVQIAEWGSVK